MRKNNKSFFLSCEVTSSPCAYFEEMEKRGGASEFVDGDSIKRKPLAAVDNFLDLGVQSLRESKSSTKLSAPLIRYRQKENEQLGASMVLGKARKTRQNPKVVNSPAIKPNCQTQFQQQNNEALRNTIPKAPVENADLIFEIKTVLKRRTMHESSPQVPLRRPKQSTMSPRLLFPAEGSDSTAEEDDDCMPEIGAIEQEIESFFTTKCEVLSPARPSLTESQNEHNLKDDTSAPLLLSQRTTKGRERKSKLKKSKTIHLLDAHTKDKLRTETGEELRCPNAEEEKVEQRDHLTSSEEDLQKSKFRKKRGSLTRLKKLFSSSSQTSTRKGKDADEQRDKEILLAQSLKASLRRSDTSHKHNTKTLNRLLPEPSGLFSPIPPSSLANPLPPTCTNNISPQSSISSSCSSPCSSPSLNVSFSPSLISSCSQVSLRCRSPSGDMTSPKETSPTNSYENSFSKSKDISRSISVPSITTLSQHASVSMPLSARPSLSSTNNARSLFPSPSSSPRMAEEQSHESWQTVIENGLTWRVQEGEAQHNKLLVAGMMGSLIGYQIEECIGNDGNIVDAERIHRFLFAYTHWTSPNELFDELKQRYNNYEEIYEPQRLFYLRKKIITFVQEWIKIKYSSDFSSSLSKQVVVWLNNQIKNDKEHDRKENLDAEFMEESDKDKIAGKVKEVFPEQREDIIESSEKVASGPTGSGISSSSGCRTPPKKKLVAKMSRFNNDMPSPYSPTSFSKKLSVGIAKKKIDLKDLKSASILSLKPLVVARQLSRIDFGLLQKVMPTEFDGLAFSSKRRDILSPNLKAIADRFNQVSYWVATEVITGATPRTRLRALQKCIAIAQKLKEIGNFASFFAVGAGLNIHSVSRLKSLWEALPYKYQTMFDEHMALLSTTRNYQNYRSTFQQRMKELSIQEPSRGRSAHGDDNDDTASGSTCTGSFPLVPYMGVITRDFTFLDEGNVNSLENGFVNYEKMELWGQLLCELRLLQRQPCTIECDLIVDNYLANFSPLTDNNLYNTSSSILPALRAL